MAKLLIRAAALLSPLAMIGCTVPPPAGPTVMALPKQNEPFSQFRAQDARCRDYAASQLGYGAASANATRNAVGSAAVGTALGAVAGAAIGSITGQMGAGAAVGAAGGLLAGSAVGANRAQYSAGELQYLYNNAYTQCMVANGYTVRNPPRPVIVSPYYGPYPYAYDPYPYGYGYGYGGW